MNESEKFTYDEKVLLSVLRWGKKNSTTQKELVQLTGYMARHIRRMISALRHKHCPIVASNNGYYLSDDLEEIESMTNTLSSYIRALLDTRDSMNEIIANPSYLEDFKALLEEASK